MASLALKISLEGGRVTKKIQFDPNTTVFDACRIIKDKFADAVPGQAHEFGLFLADDEGRQGVWLETGRNLSYYLLRDQDSLEYRRKIRTLRVRMLDGAVKTILVDDSLPVSQLMFVICTKIGITNHEEYGLVREDDPQNENQPDNRSNLNLGTLTLRKRTQEKDRDTKMETLRKKLKTDDEINWIDQGKTLREQGIDENETVLLRRKFFYSDQNIDSRDPVQLNLVYAQARDGIVNGTHPVTQDKACEFAGIQVHIQFGDHNELKHRQIDLNEFLPQSYARVKGIEKKVFAEHRKHIGLIEIDAKVLYTKIARELPTYGVTFFLVKEKLSGKNKLVPRLLGVTKDSVLRLDEKTKEILKTWPLTTVRRWGASPNTFTLDFGDYADQYYSVQTTEAEQIVQLIAGYIDIIMRKKQQKDHFGEYGDDGSYLTEDSVIPSKATIFQHESNTNVNHQMMNQESLAMPVILRGHDGEKPYTQVDGHGSVQHVTTSGQINLTHAPNTIQPTRISVVLTPPQRALMGYISAAHDEIRKATDELMIKSEAPNLGNDPTSIQWREMTIDTSKQTVTTHIAAMNAATAQVVTASQPDEIDHDAVGAAVSQIAQSIPEVTKEVRLMAALMEDDTNGDKLLDAARRLCNAFSDLLKAAEPENQQNRQNMITAATRVGEASGNMLSTIGEESAESRELHDMLLALAKAVATTTAALVLRAKSIAADCEDEEARTKVIGAASQCALATSQLVACARVVAPTLQNAACRDQLEAAAREVAKAVANLVKICNDTTSDQKLKTDLWGAAKEVSQTLTDLLEHIKLSSRERARQVREDSNPAESVLVATDVLVSSTDPQELLRQANILGQATAQLINSIKGEADQQSDSDLQRRLLDAAKQLADATARLVEAARLCSSSPHDSGHHDVLRNVAQEIRVITTTTANTPATKIKLINRLEQNAKNAATSARECIQSSRNSTQFSDDRQSNENLLHDCQTVSDFIPRLLNGMKVVADHPDEPSAQLCLIEASETFIEPGSQLANSARGQVPTVQDSNAAKHLSRSALNFSQSIHELRTSAARAREACGGHELESALEAVSNLRDVLNDTRRAAAEGALRPLPGETAETTSKQLGSTAKGVGIAMSQLLSAVSQGNRLYAGAAGRDTAVALGDFTKSVRGVAATTEGSNVINCADDVIICSMRLIEEAQRTLQNIGDPEMLTRSARDVTTSLARTVDCLPGQRDVDDALRSITELSEVLTMGEYPPSNKTYSQLQSELKAAAENLNSSGGQIVQSHASPARLASTSKDFNEAYKDLLTISLEMAGQTADDQARKNVVVSIRGVSNSSVGLLSTAKSVAADPSQPNAKNQLTAAARAVTESINYLVDVCTSAAPGQKECDNAIRNIEALRPLLDSANEPITDQRYSECFQTIVENSKKLGDGMTGMANYAKLSKRTEFCHNVNSIAEPIRGLIESAAQSAYLVGVSDPTSVAGRPGLIDQSQLARALQAIRQSCDVLCSPVSTKPQVFAAATVIAKHTSALCNSCREVSLYTNNPVAKRQFVQAAKDLAHSTAVLVEEIKALDNDYSAESRHKCIKATGPLLDAVNSLCQFASSPEFISVPARISSEGRRAQEPILDAGHKVLDGAVRLVQTAKSLIVSPQDPAVWQQIAVNSRFISESIKNVVALMRDNAPGQAQCDSALDILSHCSRDLDTASMTVGGIPAKNTNSLQGFTGQTLSAASELLEKLEPLRIAAKQNTEALSHAVQQIPRYAVPLTAGTIGVSSHVIHSNQQMELIDQGKSVIESATNLIHSAKKCAGITKDANVNQELDENIRFTREATQDLITTIDKLSTESGVVTGLMEQISRSMHRITDKRQSFLGINMSDTYVDYQARMVQSSKEIARLANEINAKAAVDPNKLPPLSVDMTQHYTHLAQDAMGASSTTTSTEVSSRIKNTVQDLGHSISNLIQLTVGSRPEDNSRLSDISHGTRDVSEKVAQVLASLYAGSRGTQACINASSTVSGIIGDLDTTIMFATAGTLNPDNDGAFSDHRELILKTAKALVEDTKVLVSGAAGSQEQLASAAQNAVSTILQLSEAVKRGACSLGANQPDSQVMVISAVKDVASALGELINATKMASGKSIHDPSMNDLKESAKVMVMNVTSLLKTVKAVEDEHTRGTRAMEATYEAISQEIRAMHSLDTSRCPPCTPEDLIRATKNVTFATSKTVAAGASNLQTDIAAAANAGRKAISEMLMVCKSVAINCAETEELRQRTIDAGAAVGNSYRDLLEGTLRHCSADERMHLSRRVAKCVTDLVAMAQLLKGSDWVDPEDPTVIAENELLGAAASIDAAAKKLANLRPRRQTDVKNADESMQFDEMILEAARGIMAASSALVRAANAAQKELIDQGRVAKRPQTSSDDGQWSEGLISAARLVAAATHSLVESAQNLVQGNGTEEMLVSSARQVAASTAALLIACRVKSDPNSETGRRLQAAGNAVIRSTDNLVRAAQQAISNEEEHILKINTSMVDGMAQEINARSIVLQRERELEEARNALKVIRQEKYSHKIAQGIADEDDYEQQRFNNSSNTNSLNRSNFNYTSSPTFQNTSTSTTTNQQYQKRTPITGNAIPRPYQSENSPTGLSPSSPGFNRSFDGTQSTTNVHSNTNLNSNVKSNLAACVQDLHEKTFGKTGVLPMTTYKYQTTKTTNLPESSNGQNYEGFTNRYETRSFDGQKRAPTELSNVDQQFSKMNLTTDNGTVSLSDIGSSRLNSMTQRVMERKTMTTTTESKSESKTEKRSFRLD